jgi:hypothetical protein
MFSPKFKSVDNVPINKVGSHQAAPNFWFMKYWAVRIACSNEAGDNVCSFPATIGSPHQTGFYRAAKAGLKGL